MEDQRIKEILIEKNRDFKELYLEHQGYEQKLRDLREKNHKSQVEQVEERNLKKQKLKLKDAMQKLIHEYKKKLR
jgi:uncharacterized protein YdcH (DUF465 family)